MNMPTLKTGDRFKIVNDSFCHWISRPLGTIFTIGKVTSTRINFRCVTPDGRVENSYNDHIDRVVEEFFSKVVCSKHFNGMSDAASSD